MRKVGKNGLTKKTTAWIMSAALVFSACPLSVQAQEGECTGTIAGEEAVEEESVEAVSEEAAQEELSGGAETTVTGEDEQTVETEETTEEMTTVESEADSESLEEMETEETQISEKAVALSAEIGNVTRTCPTIGEDGKVTFHYYAKDGETVNSAYVKGSWVGDWSQYYYMSEEADNPGVWSVTADLSLEKSYEYGIVVNDSWVGDPTNPRNGGNSEILRNPSVNSDGSVTIYYYPEGNEAVSLLYQTEGQDTYTEVEMTQDANHSALLSATVSKQGSYTYRLKIDGVETADKNSKEAVFTISKLPEDDASVESPVVEGTEVTFNYFAPTADSVNLAGQMNGWSSTADSMQYDSDTGFWSITKTLEDGQEYEYKFVINGKDWVTDPRNEIQKNGNSLVTVGEPQIVTGEYQYTIYYLDEMHQSVDEASLWIWSDNVNGTQYYFTEAVTLEDGNTWLKSEVDSPYDMLYIIPRAYDDWSWQDVDKSFANEAQDKNVTLYLVKQDAKVYTELPEIKEQEGRYVIIEYTRPAGDYEGWNIYSWNTGYGSEVTVDFQEIGGKMVALLPVVDTKESVSFCMRRSEDGNPWAEKDGGDHAVSIPLDQTVVKANFTQGEGVVGNLPYNIGYVTDVPNGEISFYYRDDTLYKNYEEASLEGKVTLILDDEEYQMTYDAANERYVYTGALVEGEHYYGYLVDGTLVTDKYNEETIEVEGKTYSKFTYEAYEAELTATVSPEVMDYNDNSVIKLSLGTGEETSIKVVEAYADLSELGMSSNFVIDTELMAGTIAAKETVSTGEKKIPVTVKDQYGNLYQTVATVAVTQRDNTSDFDWDEAVIYFAVTDRFFDGNSGNNDAYGTGTYNPDLGSMYHGGDFAGLEAKLDYLQELGVNTVWITPVVENIEVVMDCDGHEGQTSAGYHGYWAKNFTELNKHLGTEEEFASLIQAMHARGMKLMVDVVLNHVGYGTEADYDNTFIAGKNMLRDNSTTVKGDDKKDALAGLPDFVTEDREVSDLLVAWQSAWISKYDIDYFRVDTVKHVDDTTWKAFKNALTEINPDFKMIGEYAGAGYATDAGQLRTGQMDSILDFDFNDQAISFVSGSLANVEKFMENRNSGIDNTATVGSFLGSHDEDGLMYRLMNEKNYDSQKAYALMKVAATLQITAKGQPVIYYGEELGQTGANNWPYQDNRYDMNWSIANEDNDMLVHYQKLLEIRNDYTDVFAKGTRATEYLDEQAGVLVVNRSYGKDSLYVGFNINQSEEKEITLSVTPGATYTDIYSNVRYTADQNGDIRVTIPSAELGGTVVLKAGATEEKPVKPATPSESQTSQVSSQTESNEEEQSTQSVSTAALPVQPTFVKMDGTVVKGWTQVVREALKEALAEAVPLADSVDAAQTAQTPVVDITLEQNTVKVIPASVVSEMVQSGATYRFHFAVDSADGKEQEEIVYEYTYETLAEVKGDLQLDMLVSSDKDFGQGFQSLVLDPRKKMIYGTKLSIAVGFGKEHAGKPAYVFQRNLLTNSVELFDCQFLDAEGNLEVGNADCTDFIILY